MGPTEARRIDVVRESDDRHVGERVGNILRINPRNISDHKVGRLDSLGRLEAMPGQKPLEFGAKEEINPNKQDRCHA